MLKKKILEIIEILIIIFVIVFGIFVFYQLVLKIIGGSWETENLIVSLLVLNISVTFALAVNQVKNSMEINTLKYQFRCLAKDFKEHL